MYLSTLEHSFAVLPALFPLPGSGHIERTLAVITQAGHAGLIKAGNAGNRLPHVCFSSLQKFWIPSMELWPLPLHVPFLDSYKTTYHAFLHPHCLPLFFYWLLLLLVFLRPFIFVSCLYSSVVSDELNPKDSFKTSLAFSRFWECVGAYAVFHTIICLTPVSGKTCSCDNPCSLPSLSFIFLTLPL